VNTQAFTFPNPVNEVSARVVAAGVVGMASLTVALDQRWLLVPLTYGFVARALAGPRFSPLGLIATRVITPRLPVAPQYVPGPPKRFAQTLGAAVSTAATVSAFGLGKHNVARALIGMLALFATLESAFAFCVGCKIFGFLMSVKLIPEEVCLACNNVGARAHS
jgi:hypothetical protein